MIYGDLKEINVPLKSGMLSTYDLGQYTVSDIAAPFSMSWANTAYFPTEASLVQLRKTVLSKASLCLYCCVDAVPTTPGGYTPTSTSIKFEVATLASPFDSDALRKQGYLLWSELSNYTYLRNANWEWVEVNLPLAANGEPNFQNGLRMANADGYTSGYTERIHVYPPNTAFSPYIKVSYYDVAPVVLSATPRGGWVSPNKDLVLSWTHYFEATPDPVEVTNSLLEWQVGAEEVHQINLGTATSYTIPASQLPAAGGLRWRVTLTAENGLSSDPSDWYELTTIEAAPVVKVVNPVAGFLVAEKETEFTWDYSVSTGTPPSAYEVQCRGSGDWRLLSAAETAATSATADTTVFPAGTFEWRVRARNQSGVWSEWSEPAQLVLISSPAAPVVSVTSGASPQPVVVWQSAGQSGYQVMVGDVDTGVRYGTAQTHTYDGYLPDGVTLIRVRVQNQFELWSDWGVCAVDVRNSLPTADTLVVGAQSTGHADAQLKWPAIGSAQAYLVYRDGELIAKCGATQAQYTDFLGVGTVSYQVRAVFESGNYVLSDPVELTLIPRGAQIRALDGDVWLDISHATTSLPSVTTARTRAVAHYNYVGAMYPVAEVSPFETMTYSLSLAFKREDPAVTAFDALMGETVVVKDQYSNLVVGVLGTWTKTQNAFLVSYKAQVTQIDRSLYAVSKV